MDATEISPITEEAIADLLSNRANAAGASVESCRRENVRWPFPGAVEMWLPDEDGTERHYLATCSNLSIQGVGLIADCALPVGLEFDLAVHQPEASFHGRGIVRHCTEADVGFYVGVQFVFDA